MFSFFFIDLDLSLSRCNLSLSVVDFSPHSEWSQQEKVASAELAVMDATYKTSLPGFQFQPSLALSCLLLSKLPGHFMSPFSYLQLGVIIICFIKRI